MDNLWCRLCSGALFIIVRDRLLARVRLRRTPQTPASEIHPYDSMYLARGTLGDGGTLLYPNRGRGYLYMLTFTELHTKGRELLLLYDN